MIRLCAFSDEAASDLNGQIDALLRNDIHLMEIRNVEGKGVADITESEAEKYARILSKNGIEVWSIGSPLGKVNINVDMEGYLGTVRHICRLANIFGTDKVRAFSFFEAYNKKAQVIKSLTQMTETAMEYDIYLYHENEKEIYGDTVERTDEILKSVPMLKSVYDPANFIQVGEDSKKALDTLHARADYFHIKDVIKETGELVPAGYGDGLIYELITKINGDKVLTLEPHLAIFDAYKSIDSTEMKHKFKFESKDEAFDTAVSELKKLIIKAGYKSVNGGFEK